MNFQPSDRDRTLDAYQYNLPPDRIAQNPVTPRDHAQLMVVGVQGSKSELETGAEDETAAQDAGVKLEAETGVWHGQFRDLNRWLRPGDLLVLNDTRVIPARLYGRKPGGATVEILLLEPQASDQWLALVKPGRRLKPGAVILFGDLDPCLKATVLKTDAATGGRLLQFDVPDGETLTDLIQRLGQVPLPPYITNSTAAADRYQTVYAERPGAVAAPTAGLHFTPNLLETLQTQGVQRAFITLHVGLGTFRPVEIEDITTHQMHEEWIEVPAATVMAIEETRANGGRVIAVGTTVTRALEGAAATGTLQPYCGKTDIFIYPGYEWRVIDGLITNFHLPGSSLLMMVSALIGRERLLELYQMAIAQNYRFYSFGDAMLILPEAKLGCER